MKPVVTITIATILTVLISLLAISVVAEIIIPLIESICLEIFRGSGEFGFYIYLVIKPMYLGATLGIVTCGMIYLHSAKITGKTNRKAIIISSIIWAVIITLMIIGNIGANV